MVVEDLSKGVPKGKYRKELEQSEQKVMLEFHRYMSSIQIKNAILQAFKHLPLHSFQYLLCKDKTSLVLNTDQSQDGNKIINSIQTAKGFLYLLKCKESAEGKHDSGDDSIDLPPGPIAEVVDLTGPDMVRTCNIL